MGSSSEEDVDTQDGEMCTEAEINQLFSEPLHLSTEEAISLKKNYILHMDVSQTFDKVVAATSQNTVHLFDLHLNNGHHILNHSDIRSNNIEEICGVKYSKACGNTVFICASSGKIYQRDLRQQNPECLNLNVFCVGTEQTSSESLLLFYDYRQRSPLFEYRDCHRDDITDVKFHPSQPNVVGSGSTDGLINLFDISNSTEDDALQHCLNTESSVQTLNWHQSLQGTNRISCITHLNDFIVYDVEESEEIVSFKRNDITKLIRRKSPSECYLVNTHTVSQDEVLLVAGSNYNKGECLRTLKMAGKELIPRNSINSNKQIVRCSAYDAKNDVLITAGEGGIVSVWQKPSLCTPSTNEKRKEVKQKDRKSKPY